MPHILHRLPLTHRQPSSPSPKRGAAWAWLLCLTFLPALALAQAPPEAAYPYRRDIEKQKFDKAQSKLFRHLLRDSNNMECHYAAYQLYFTPDYAHHSTDSAYLHLCKARSLYSKGDNKMIERWARDSYSGALFDYGLRRIGSLALAYARSVNTPDAYRHLLDLYTLVPDDIRDSATRCRDTVEYAIALRAGAVEDVEDFIRRRPQSLLLPTAVHHRDSVKFIQADRRHTAAAYQQFCTEHPASEYTTRATDSLYLLQYRDALRHNSEQFYRSYADRYPLSPYAPKALWQADSLEYHHTVDTSQWQSLLQYVDNLNRTAWRDTALHALTRFAIQRHHLQAADHAARRLSPGTHDHALIALLLHDAYLHTSIRNFHRFYALYPHLMSATQRQADSLAYLLNEQYDYSMVDSCIRQLAPAHEAYMMLQQVLKDDIDHGRFAAAASKAKAYAPAFGQSHEYNQLLATLTADLTADKGYTTPLPGKVNTPKGDEYAPVMSATGRTIYFAGKNREGNIGGEDIFVSHLTKNGWTQPEIVMDLSHTYGNEAPMSLSPDGNHLLLYQTGRLRQADLTPEGWQTTQLPDALLHSRWQADATLAANGRVMLFAALGRTHREVDSSLNIYCSLLDSNGRWSAPFEIGPAVNTPFDERSPYLHPDMRTLYFASEGHGSLGQMDLYMTTRLDDSFTRWSTPVNVGRQINTTGDDWGHKVSTNGKTCYFARRQASSDIFTSPLPAAVQPQPVTLVSGSVKDLQGRPVATLLRWEDPSTGQLLGQCHTNPLKGTFLILLPQGSLYSLYIADTLFFPTSLPIDLTLPQSDKSLSLSLVATRLQEMLDGATVTLSSVAFPAADPHPSAASTAELRRVSHLIGHLNRPAVLAVHVDGNIGDPDNLALTQRRADNLLQTLVDFGASRSLITAIGYGSNQPLQLSPGTSSKTARPQNRRATLTLQPENN